MNTRLLPTHFKIALRNLGKNRSYSLINIFGLALGLAACLLVLAYTRFESSYDRTHPHVDRLYRVNQTNIWDPDGGVMSSTTPPLAATLLDNYPEVEAATRINTPGPRLVRYLKNDGEVTAFNEQNVLAADSSFFEFFDFPLKEGNPETALQGVGKAVLSAETAQRYFGEEPALGKVLEFGAERLPVTVSGVARTQALNLHFHFDILLSMPTNPDVEAFDWSWIWTQVVTYVRLKPGADARALEAKFPDLVERFVAPSFSRLGMNYEDFMENKGDWNFYLQPVGDIHLYSAGIGNRIGPVGNIATVRLMRIIALFILLIAVLNFINLSTARASTRAREIGVKKAMGALRSGLVQQFLMESVLVTGLSMGLALGTMHLLKWGVLWFSGIDIPVGNYLQPARLPGIIALTLLVGLLAGVYPAFYLSRFKPVDVLKGKVSGGVKNPVLRNVLVTAQFTISIGLMAGAVLVHQQLKFMENKDLGYDTEQVLVINHAEKLGAQIESFRNEVQQYPEVVNASLAMDMPGRGSWEDIYSREGSDIKLSISQNKIDAYHFPTMGFSLAAGRAFEKGRPADRNGLIINETTARLFGWKNEEALGRKIVYPDYPEDLVVIGVVKDYHFQSLRQNIAPMMFFDLHAEVWGDQRVLAIKYARNEEEKLLAKLERDWGRMTENVPFDYSFFDEETTRLYQEERNLSGLITLFTGFSLFIAVIGLIGLLSFATEQRRKEIGIRKVLGASHMQIFSLINYPYLRLFFLAALLAVPLSWHSMREWLDAFAYRVEIDPSVYLLAGGLVIVFSALSVSYLSLRAASANPAEVLKDE